ncbi:MAG: alginate lyase family protein [Gammaproteobacteria bacterium]|nr:alginate lyase family protein [Gammaproteobacteria bacterium]
MLDGARLSVVYRPEHGQWSGHCRPPRVGPARYEAVIPATAVTAPLQAQTVLEVDGQRQEGDIVSIALMQRPLRPNLLFSKDELVAMKAKVDRFEWAKASYDSVMKAADDFLDEPVDPPPGPGGWSHDYVCPNDGARLQMRSDHPHDHLCPVCGKEWQGEKLDGNWRNSQHSRLASAARNLGLAYQFTGDAKYGRKGAEILNWYAAHYAEFSEGRGPAGRGKVMSQSLTECGWLIQMISACDLLDGALTPEEPNGGRAAVRARRREPDQQVHLRDPQHPVLAQHLPCDRGATISAIRS